MIMPSLQMRGMRLREMEQLPKGGKQRQGKSSSPLTPKPVALDITKTCTSNVIYHDTVRSLLSCF